MMKAFFSKRKNGGKSHSDSSLYPPPTLSATTRRAHASAADMLDYASSPTSTVSSSASASAAAPWDGKCARCRKLMSRCLCHEDEAEAAARPTSAHAHGYADEFMFTSERSASNARSPSIHAEDAKGDKRMLLETLSGMHQSRSRSRVPLKMTQDRSRDRRLRESQRMPNHTVLAASTSSSQNFAPTRSVGPSKSTVGDEDPSGDYFTRSCPDVKWRSSSAIHSTMRLAHDREASLPPRSGQPKNLLAYDNKKLTNRYNHAHSAATTTPVTATATTSATKGKTLPRTPSGNLYISEPIARRRRDNEGNEDFSRVWEL